MKRKLPNTTSKILPAVAVLLLLTLWQIAGMAGMISEFLLPSPLDVGKAFVVDFPLLMSNARVTLGTGGRRTGRIYDGSADGLF